jgi:hypothetical protein
MTPPLALQDFVAEVVHAHPSAKFEFSPLPSGVCFFWVTIHDRNFVLEYSPQEGVGVSENLADTPPFVGHDHFFPRLEDGIERMRAFLREAAKAVPSDFRAA